MPKRRRKKSARTLAGSAGGTINQIHHNDPPLTPAIAAALLDMNPCDLLDLAGRNAVPSHRIDGRLRFFHGDLRRWMAAGRPTGKNAADRIRQGVA
jgi:hypothetical protein